MGMTLITLRNTGSTDHIAFDAVDIPAFQFHQDHMDYGNLTHHSNQDSYEHIRPGDLQQAAIIIAGFVYDAAMCDEMLPRKPIRPDDPPAKADAGSGAQKSGPPNR
jgi:Zn-dependent M28 family amino/carboxypeptidase